MGYPNSFGTEFDSGKSSYKIVFHEGDLSEKCYKWDTVTKSSRNPTQYESGLSKLRFYEGSDRNRSNIVSEARFPDSFCEGDIGIRTFSLKKTLNFFHFIMRSCEGDLLESIHNWSFEWKTCDFESVFPIFLAKPEKGFSSVLRAKKNREICEKHFFDEKKQTFFRADPLRKRSFLYPFLPESNIFGSFFWFLFLQRKMIQK